MSTPLRIAVVGSGIGVEHIKGFQELPELFEVKALCDVNLERAAPVAEKYGIGKLARSLDEVCRLPEIDVIDLCTPPAFHFAQIDSAVKAGKHVICEKPLVGSLAAVDSVARLAEGTDRRIMPIFQYRFGHGLQKLKYLIEQNLTGEAFVFNVDVAWWRDGEYYRNPWRGKRATELGGALLSQAIHAVDMVLYILGPAKSVFGRASTRVNMIEVEDCVAMALEMRDGSLGTISVTLGSLAEISRHRFTFRNLTAESNTEPYANSCDPWAFSFNARGNEKQVKDALEQFTPAPERYAGQFSRFYQALRDETDLPVTIADARAALEIVAATYHSSERNEPVTLPIGPGHPKYETL
ncbi:MAG: Gfo/Idh/MocA family oxidoreductase [Verrucomicrobia bacterium]|nr:Gfo/Idh/MocA family oxidoreductase [Verrucomicrobiota bacterium]